MKLGTGCFGTTGFLPRDALLRRMSLGGQQALSREVLAARVCSQHHSRGPHMCLVTIWNRMGREVLWVIRSVKGVSLDRSKSRRGGLLAVELPAPGRATANVGRATGA